MIYTSKTRRKLFFIFVSFLFLTCIIISRERKDEERMSLKDVESLPLVRTEIREKENCPGVTERIEYRLITNDNGNEEEISIGYVNDEVVVDPIAINMGSSWLNSSQVTRPSLNCLNQQDEKLIEIIKNDYLKPPSRTAGHPYKFSVPIEDLNYFSDAGQAEDIDDLFDNNLYNGFFIEAGSLDSEHFSTTLLLELERNWTGLLVEPIPLFHSEGLLKNRKATHLQTCLATERKPHYVLFDVNEIYERGSERKKAMGGIRDTPHSINMQCLPIYSIIQALGNITIQYFSLDIEGAELQVNI